MEKIKFDAVFPIICSALVEKISSELNLSDEDAIKKLYSSRIYEFMEREETKFWQYSTEKLFEMYLEETCTGNISFPPVWVGRQVFSKFKQEHKFFKKCEWKDNLSKSVWWKAMNKMIDFTVFCLESYRQANNLTGKAVLKVFNDNKVFDYIKSFYDVLHSTGQDYIVQDIDLYINSRNSWFYIGKYFPWIRYPLDKSLKLSKH